ncbi:uncharacterized protein B0T23DRAFT_143419 [Neurospora hispaniola]|uniref:Secreted protein n=1 Tax=Neurospora hispaniola TaxID=588809 RepID=A0AAJ0I7Q3_9PEZI|nr:hypothetical protein B0T23DRAFT_143419 [Neurospora hispaniola]
MFLVCWHRGLEKLFWWFAFLLRMPASSYFGGKSASLVSCESIYEVSHGIALVPISSPPLRLLLPQSNNRLVFQCIQHRPVWDPQVENLCHTHCIELALTTKIPGPSSAR